MGGLLQIRLRHGVEIVSMQLFGLAIDVLEFQTFLRIGVNHTRSFEIVVEEARGLRRDGGIRIFWRPRTSVANVVKVIFHAGFVEFFLDRSRTKALIKGIIFKSRCWHLLLDRPPR